MSTLLEDTVQSIRDLSISETLELDEEDNYKDTDKRDEDIEEERDEELDQDSEEDNEFLNSSSFLSNSQIIRSSNVNSLKSVNTSTTVIRSPTRFESDADSERKNHFQLFIPLEQQNMNSDNSDNEDDDELRKEHDYLINYKVNEEKKQGSPHSMRFHPRSGSAVFIDIDNKDATPKLPRIHPDSTPWRKLRPASMFLKDNISIGNQKTDSINDQMSSNFMKSFFDENPVNISAASPARTVSMFEASNSPLTEESGSSSASYELNNLRKQITNYKVQLRILTEYIRTLLKTTNNFDGLKNELMTKLEKENGLLLNERELLQNELYNKNNVKSEPEIPYDIENDPKYTSKIEEILDLKNDLISIKNQNDDLSSIKDNLQKESADREKEIQFHLSKLSNYETLLNELLSHLLNFLKGESAKAVKKAKSSSIDSKIKVITFAINELLEDFEELGVRLERSNQFRNTKTSAFDERTVPSDLVHHIKSELEASKATENELKKLLNESSESFTKLKNGYNSLNTRYKENLNIITHLKKIIGEKQTEITTLSDKILDLEASSIERSEFKPSENDAELLKNRINVIKSNHSKEIEMLTTEIDELKTQLTASTRSKRISGTDSFKDKQEMQNLKLEIQRMKDDFFKSSKNYENSIENLQNLLKLNKQEFEVLTSDFQNLQKALQRANEESAANERDYKRKLDHAAKELNQSVAKQRTIAAEKSKYSFALEDLRRENSKLNLNNNTLLEKVNRLSYQVSNLGEYEIGFKNLHQLSVSNLQNLLADFENVLEPGSIRQAESKLKKLKDPNLVDLEAIHSLHRSLLSYFENAIVSIMTEYSEMYATRQEIKGDNEVEMNRLRDEIHSLTEELEWCYENGNFNEDGEDGDKTFSERTKLRLEELERRRRMEREQRKSEHLTFSARIKTLEAENAALRGKLKILDK